jgi:cytochrome c556
MWRPVAALRRLAGLLACGLAACAPPAQLSYEERLERTPAPAEHGVHSERLQQVMGGLERLSRERLPQAMDVREARERRVAVVVSVALAMADSAERIPAVVADVELEGEAREAFLGHAEALRRRALALAEAAPHLSMPALRAELDSVEATCQACHQRFRPPVPGGDQGPKPP